jgi:CheY-like chemotaxis protein/Tfp pilus assembly protein PilZ
MTRKKVLLVDDVNLIIELEKAFLKGLPVDIVVARDGEQALEMVEREKPDLIYMDLNMPVMDGPTCCRLLKSNPATREIPIIMVTTAGSAQDELLCRSSGCDDFITKPINGKLFLEKGRARIADFERRRCRYEHATKVVFLAQGEPKYGLTADISKGGLFIAIPGDSKPDEPVDLSFTLSREGTSLLVAARGRIAWENPVENPKKPSYPPGFGVEFTDIEPEIITRIEGFFQDGLATKKK